MSLSSDFDQACDDLHHVINYHKVFPAKQYQFLFGWEDNFPFYKPLFANVMEWDFTTPPAVADIYLWEDRVNHPSTDPIISIHFVIIDCNPTITFKNTSHWWYGLSLSVKLAQGAPHNIRWVNIVDPADLSHGIGFYKFPFEA